MEKSKKMISVLLFIIILAAPTKVFSANAKEMSEDQVMQIAEEIGVKYNISQNF